MARGFADYLHRMAQQFAASALIVQQVAMLRPCKVLDLTRDDIRLPGDIVLTGTSGRVAGLVITNGKTAKNGKPQVAIVEDKVAVEVLEILMFTSRKMPKSTNLFAQLTYAR